METPLDHQCSNDAPRAGSLLDLLRRTTARLAARGFLSSPSQAASLQIATSAPTDSPTPTPAELEALRWTMDGMTDTEIATKLGLPEHEIASRLRSAMGKLGCKTKYEAVLKAIKLRLIEVPR